MGIPKYRLLTGTPPLPSGRGINIFKAAKVLQTGGHTLKNATLKTLGITKEQGKTAIEALKRAEGLPHNFHGKIMSNGDLVHPRTNSVLGNLFDYLP